MVSRRFGSIVLGGLVVMGACSGASASHIFFENVKLNGVSLETTAGFTNPLVVTTTGTPIILSWERYSHNGTSDTLTIDFTYVSGTLAAPLDTTKAFNGLASDTAPELQTYSFSYATTGTLNANVFMTSNTSFPNYYIPGVGESGDSRTFPFQLQVNAIPEPTSLSLLLGGVGAVLARRKR